MIDALTHHALPVLADAAGDASSTLTLWAIGTLAALALFADHITAVWDRFRQKPPPGEVFATREELRQVHARVDNMLTSMGGSMEKLTAELKGAIDKLGEKVDEELKEVRAENKEVNKSLASIHRSLGRLEGHEEGGHHHG